MLHDPAISLKSESEVGRALDLEGLDVRLHLKCRHLRLSIAFSTGQTLIFSAWASLLSRL